ncbi:hypothetical protein OE88DRAFT_1804082 [Heliocybe sulcata]|uniref:Uncharacterized protein n=1 Tax=Heliocybe sulcata TaxID=5364 RepID=A0A5C3NL11_9AGAM|nr:hypothetical protein OE88DRAFT_1804082 [Heliocybe sulcata]
MRKLGRCVASILFFFLCIGEILAVLTNVTVDDNNGDPVTHAKVTYSPAGVWNFGPQCVACTAHPDPNQVYMRTWHDATYYPTEPDNITENIVSMSVPFNGSAIYVYCILTFTFDHPAGNSDMRFLIDNDIVGVFELPPNGSTTYDYHYPVYVNESIETGPHTFRLESGYNNTKSVVIFDYMVYSYDNGTTSPTASSIFPSQSPGQDGYSQEKHGLPRSLTTTIAAVVSAVGAMILVFATTLFLLRRRRRRTRAADGAATPEASAPVSSSPEGPGSRWLARYSDNGDPLQCMATTEQHSWLAQDPYPSSNPAHPNVSSAAPSSATYPHYSANSTGPLPATPTVRSKLLSTPITAPSSFTKAYSATAPSSFTDPFLPEDETASVSASLPPSYHESWYPD